jgi:hypothetical protein
MRKVLLFEPVELGVFVLVSCAGAGVGVMAGLRMFEGKADRAVGWAIGSERSGGEQIVVKAPCGEEYLCPGCEMFDGVGSAS